eukprot:CAMPEP_0171882208 /NCGR_PEP_ID=MMETSP0992-20121227/39460_1 /TAXON_ID=483369 /ORGANISM="non described non described, Strain CCMP2098" /LENGTH=44 /DNA_ID= /DNA_START= /DNA_END= /DNA_ORIENTATION=
MTRYCSMVVFLSWNDLTVERVNSESSVIAVAATLLSSSSSSSSS